MNISRKARGVIAVALLAVVSAACQPGWVNPWVGSADGTGTTPGATTPVSNTGVALKQPTSVVAIPGGGFYVYDATACAIYKVDNDTTTLYAGTPGTCGDTGDGGPATQATLDSGQGLFVSNDLALASDGTLYFADVDQNLAGRVRAISPAGIISHVNGCDASLGASVAGATDGSIFCVTYNKQDGATSISRVSSSGTTQVFQSARTLMGVVAVSSTELIYGASQTTWGGDAPITRLDLTTTPPTETQTGYTAEANLGDGIAVAAAADGTVYFASNVGSSLNQVLRLDPDNTVTPIAGTGTADPATRRQVGDGLALDLSPTGLAVTPNNGLLISSGHLVYRLDQPTTAGPTTTTTSTTSTTTTSTTTLPAG